MSVLGLKNCGKELKGVLLSTLPQRWAGTFMSRLCQNPVNPAIKVERAKRSLPDVSSSGLIIPWEQPKGKDQRTLQIEYPPPEFILPGRCTAKTSVWKTERAYQRGENAAVRSWGRKVYGVWPRNNQQGHRESGPFYPCPNLLKVGLAFMQTAEIVKPANYFSKWEIGLPLWLLHCDIQHRGSRTSPSESG